MLRGCTDSFFYLRELIEALVFLRVVVPFFALWQVVDKLLLLRIEE